MGVASALIKHLLLKTDELGLGELYLQCELGLVEFYQDLGFTHLHSSQHGELDTEVMVGRMPKKNRTYPIDLSET